MAEGSCQEAVSDKPKSEKTEKKQKRKEKREEQKRGGRESNVGRETTGKE